MIIVYWLFGYIYPFKNQLKVNLNISMAKLSQLGVMAHGKVNLFIQKHIPRQS